MWVTPLCGQLDLADQLHLDALVLHFLAGYIGYLHLRQQGWQQFISVSS